MFNENSLIVLKWLIIALVIMWCFIELGISALYQLNYLTYKIDTPCFLRAKGRIAVTLERLMFTIALILSLKLLFESLKLLFDWLVR